MSTDKTLSEFKVVCSDRDHACPCYYYNDEGGDDSCNLGFEIRNFNESELVLTKLEYSVKWPSELVLSKKCKLNYLMIDEEKKFPKKLLYKCKPCTKD